jgi:hypothetical protein
MVARMAVRNEIAKVSINLQGVLGRSHIDSQGHLSVADRQRMACNTGAPKSVLQLPYLGSGSPQRPADGICVAHLPV